MYQKLGKAQGTRDKEQERLKVQGSRFKAQGSRKAQEFKRPSREG